MKIDRNKFEKALVNGWEICIGPQPDRVPFKEDQIIYPVSYVQPKTTDNKFILQFNIINSELSIILETTNEIICKTNMLEDELLYFLNKGDFFGLYLLVRKTGFLKEKFNFIKKFEKALEEGYRIEFEVPCDEDVIITDADGVYGLGHTTNESNTLDFDLVFDTNSMEMIWKIDGEEKHRVKYTEDEIINLLESGNYFNTIFEHCYDTEGDSWRI